MEMEINIISEPVFVRAVYRDKGGGGRWKNKRLIEMRLKK